MSTPTADLEAFIWELRRCFRELARAADLHLRPLGIQAGDRALLEFLARAEGPVSISELARRTAVSRQHIHQGLKRLPRPGWVEAGPNPADSRTLDLRLSSSGRSFWRRVRARDAAFLKRLGRELPAAEIGAALAVLKRIRSCLADITAEAAND